MKCEIASLLFAGAALAAPHEQFQRGPRTEVVCTTVWTTTTIYVDASTQASSSRASTQISGLVSSASTSVAQVSSVPSISLSRVASSSVVVVPSASASPIKASSAAPGVSSVAPAVSSVAPAPSRYVAPVVSVAPAPSPSVAPAVSVVPAASSAQPQAPSAAPASAAPVVAAVAATVQSYVGQATYYEVSNGQPGSCGILRSDNDPVVALALSFMNNGGNPNKNPLCGKTIKIQGETRVHTATIYDSCAGCANTDVDLSPSLFKAAFPNGDGRVNNVKWWIE